MAQDLHYAFTGSTFWWSSRLRYVTMITLRAHAVIYIRVTKHCFNTLNQTTLSIFSPPGPYSKSLPTTESFTLLTADGDGLISSSYFLSYSEPHLRSFCTPPWNQWEDRLKYLVSHFIVEFMCFIHTTCMFDKQHLKTKKGSANLWFWGCMWLLPPSPAAHCGFEK